MNAEPAFVGGTRMAFGILLMEFPLLYALVVYAKKSTAIWQNRTSQRQDD